MKERIKRLERSARRLQKKAKAREPIRLIPVANWLGNDREPIKLGEIHVWAKWGKREREDQAA